MFHQAEITNNITTDCLIYHKNRSQQDLEYVKDMLSRRRLTYTQLQYGSYKVVTKFYFYCLKSMTCSKVIIEWE